MPPLVVCNLDRQQIRPSPYATCTFIHIIPWPTTAAQRGRAQIPLTPEEDPQQKSALRAKKKREEADNLERRGNRHGVAVTRILGVKDGIW